MTCREFVAFLLDYVEDQLPAPERDRFDAHLSVCPDCVRYLKDYRQAIRAGRIAFTEDCPDDIPEELVAAIVSSRLGT